MMACALTGPMPGRASSISLGALLILTFWPGASFAAAEAGAFAAGALVTAAAEGAAGGAGAAFAAGAAGAAAAGAAAPTVTKGFTASICFADKPAFDSSSTDL